MPIAQRPLSHHPSLNGFLRGGKTPQRGHLFATRYKQRIAGISGFLMLRTRIVTRQDTQAGRTHPVGERT